MRQSEEYQKSSESETFIRYRDVRERETRARLLDSAPPKREVSGRGPGMVTDVPGPVA